MKVIIAGSRAGMTMPIVEAAMREACGMDVAVTEVVSGCARGVDRYGEHWAAERGIPIKRFEADWKRYGRRAGPLRNRKMAEYADALVAVWNGHSPGTANMIETAKALGLKVHVHRVEGR